MKTRIAFGLVAVALLALLSGCGNSEREKKLQARNDSLAVVVKSNEEAMVTLQEVGVLLDSIDQNRTMLRVIMVEGTSKENYSHRLKSINNYVVKAEKEIVRLEDLLKTSSASKAGYVGTVHRLKAELLDVNKQLAVLQEEAMQLRNDKGVLITQVAHRDSTITERELFIKVKEAELLAKEDMARQMSEQTQADKADLYFAQAKALDIAADRTKLAPRKKKETRREALELYKIALSLGKTEAQIRITELEKQIG